MINKVLLKPDCIINIFLEIGIKKNPMYADHGMIHFEYEDSHKKILNVHLDNKKCWYDSFTQRKLRKYCEGMNFNFSQLEENLFKCK